MAQTLEENYRETTQEVSKALQDGARRVTLRERLGKRFNRTIVGIGLVFVVALAGLYFYAQAASYESTDDAFIAAHTIEVAPKIAGKIDSVFVKDNQLVKKGDLLVEIDPRDYDAQLDQKQAARDSVKAEVLSAQAAVDQQ
ncbi:MAG TPA: biotin/lipoyl-binding protein, partial [Chthoniobacterales bacterium]|nr:biotin/lipoyl-binding protein [Chthoniobacterales bacterium]